MLLHVRKHTCRVAISFRMEEEGEVLCGRSGS